MKPFLVVLASFAVLLAFAPLQGGAAPPVGFTLSPSSLTFSAASGCFTTGCYQYQNVTVSVTHGAIVIQNPASFTGDIVWGGGYSTWFDTQGGTCWQQYEALGNKIPPRTTCTIEVGFHPQSPDTYPATMTVSRCTSWHFDPTFGFIVCDTFDGSQTVSLTGTGT